MGSWSVSCGISNIAITANNECCIIPLKAATGGYDNYLPCTLPIFGKYDDYGGMEDIIENENTKLIEEYFGITIDEFIEFLVDGKHTYDRSELDPIREKLSDSKLSELEEWRFMWVDKQVYDIMSKNHDEYEKGKHEFGTPEMLNLLGFVEIKDGNILNNDPKRFNKKYKLNDLIMYSDGRTLLSETNNYISHSNSKYGLTKYLELPKELEYLKTKTSYELWRFLSDKDQKEKLIYIFGESRYKSSQDDFEAAMNNNAFEKGLEKPYKIKEKKIYRQYFDDLEIFGDSIVGLINVKSNMSSMSSRFSPHVLYLTPQCGEYEIHQILLEEFVKINKSYIYNEDED